MKKILFILSFSPLLVAAQNIINTLGASGTYVIENSTNTDVVLINPTGPLLVLGNQPAGFAPSLLPVGPFNFISNQAQGIVNIVTANAGNKSELNFLFCNGTLTNGQVQALGTGDILGTIGFGGAISGSAWNATGATITATATSNLSGVNYATKIDLRTSNGSGGSNTMTYNSGGNLIVPASVTSQAITTTAVNYAATLSDQTIICTAALTITLPDASSLTGKTFTVKQDGAFTITINSSAGLIDGNASISILDTNVTGTGFVTVQSNGTNWYVIGQGNGF